MIQSLTYWLALFASVFAFWIAPRNARPWVLAGTSILYVATLDVVVTASLLGWIIAFFFLSRVAAGGGRYSWLLPALVISILSYLAYFKYLPVILHALGPEADNGPLRLIVPLGISYFTFKLIHYAIEMKRSSLPEHGPGDFLAYIFMFPIYTAGPIERFDHFMRNRAERFDRQDVLEGLTRIVHGLIKKFILGGLVLISLRDAYAAEGVRQLLADLSSVHPLRVWLFVILTYLIIYMDFSAYSDIAIGSSRLFGIRIMENFNFPVIAVNIGNFWKRWHMTLAGWCQSYIYMPTIGITRNPYVAVIATFTAIGVWHGASWLWLLWGLYHALGVVAFLSWSRWRRKKGHKSRPGGASVAFGRIATFLFVAASFSFTSVYGHGNAYDAVRIMARLVGIVLP